MLTVEELAKELHEAGREAVEKGYIVNQLDHMDVRRINDDLVSIKYDGRKFKEWDEISEDAREGRRIQARFLLGKFIIIKKLQPVGSFEPQKSFEIGDIIRLGGLDLKINNVDGNAKIVEETEGD